MKIVVVGLGYVGMSNAILLALNNEVIGVDISPERVEMVERGASPVVDDDIDRYLQYKDLNLSATNDLKSAIQNCIFF